MIFANLIPTMMKILRKSDDFEKNMEEYERIRKNIIPQCGTPWSAVVRSGPQWSNMEEYHPPRVVRSGPQWSQ